MTRYFSLKVPPAQITEARKRMAMLPAINKPISSVFYIENEDPEDLPMNPLWVPLAIVHNVHILPGIPVLFQHMTKYYFKQVLLPKLQSTHQRRFRRLFGTALGEGDLAEKLTSVHINFKGKVQLGSYPNWKLIKLKDAKQDDTDADSSIRVVITMEADHKQDIDDCANMLINLLPVQELNEDRSKKEKVKE